MEFSIDKKHNLMDPVREMASMLSVLFVLSLAAFLVAHDKSVTIASALVFFYVLRRFYAHLSVLNSFFGHIASVSGPASAIRWVLNDKEKYFVPEGGIEFKGLVTDIEFKNLTFGYVNDRVVLKDLSFVIEKEKMTAIVGPTGAGKTTIISLILRFYDCPPASIFINGIDIRDYTFHSLMKSVAYVSQDMLLFNDTIKVNLTYGLNRKVSQEEMANIIHKAQLFDYIASLPDGMDTIIGDRGIVLSGGEKQRVSIARALLKGAEILVLDEATSSMDTKTEHMIQEAMEEAIKGKTVIAIAHRLSTIKNADKILVIEDGRLVEEGSLEGLLQKKCKFYESWNEQRFF
jgi:subfamily B ATP-binding cassette protein MsbA